MKPAAPQKAQRQPSPLSTNGDFSPLTAFLPENGTAQPVPLADSAILDQVLPASPTWLRDWMVKKTHS